MPQVRTVARFVLAAIMVVIGVDHFVRPDTYGLIVPPPLPPRGTVLLSGVFEILGGAGLLVPATRRFSAFGLIALYVAVFPANVYQAVTGVAVPGLITVPWMMWARLPFQAVFIAWAWWVRADPDDAG